MEKPVITQVKEVISQNVRLHVAASAMPDDFKLAGESLDSMAVTSLLLALEEHFGFTFDDDELSVEAFATVASLTELVERKLEYAPA